MTQSGDLIARLERLDGPDREVDVAIYGVLNELAEPFKEYLGMAWVSADKATTIPQFTKSLDAALTLVPEDMVFSCHGTEVWLYERAAGEMRQYQGHSHLAITLCIAAIKARAALTTTEGR